MKKNIIIINLFLTFFCYAQKDVFDTARIGTVDEMIHLYCQNENVIEKVNENGFTPLILATYKSNNPVARLLVEISKNLDFNSNMGTALLAATYKGNIEILEVLLQKGANPNLTDNKGMTALMLASQFENETIVNKLLEYKADKTILNSEGKTAFEYAVFSGNTKIIELLK